MKQNWKLFIACLAALLACSKAYAQQSSASTAPKSNALRTVSRLLWQDTTKGEMRWGNLQKGDTWQLTGIEISGHPKLDTEASELVQMKELNGILLTGVHDHEDGSIQSGWIAIDSGVDKEAHGDHFHWRFSRSPTVIASKLDTEQGNPAHLYVYDERFYLANDAKDGFTVIDPHALRARKPADRFFAGGGGHITLAALENKVCYSTWIDREGDNQGRVDVVPLHSAGGSGYKIQLPSGGIHGATMNSSKAFFATSDGISWVEADKDVSHARSVQIQTLSLGKDANDKPLRTGAFANHLQWVLCVTGTGAEACLCTLDASSPKPSVAKFALNLDTGSTVTTPVTVKTLGGQHYALMFQESKDGTATEKLLVVELDSNKDGRLGDLSLAKSIEVGASQIEGHSGHHEVTITPSRRYAILTNPGSGSIWLLSLIDLSVQARLDVGGSPTHIVAVGG